MGDQNLYRLVYDLNPSDPESCSDLDPKIAEKLESLDDVYEISYYLCYGDSNKNFPEIKKRINNLIAQSIDDSEDIANDINWSGLNGLASWLEPATQTKLANAWMDNEGMGADTLWLLEFIDDITVSNVKILSRLTDIYKKKKKSRQVIKLIENIFANVSSDNLEEACKIISKATPAVKAGLLRRKDIPEKYTIGGLRALSKLSQQKEFDIEIDFNTLAHLGPKGRLDAMKQLMGMFDRHYKYMKKYQNNTGSYYSNYYYNRAVRNYNQSKTKYKSPFKTEPTRDEVAKFLFPCCLKYNDEVVTLMERYDEIVNQTEGGDE